MKGRFGLEFICHECGKDDKITAHWRDQHSYDMVCDRCNKIVKGKRK